MVAIAISGKMGSGKTTLTQEVIRQLEMKGFQAQQVSLGGAVKEVAHRYFNMSPDFKDRELLQKIGQQFRAIRSSVWIDLIVAQTPSRLIVARQSMLTTLLWQATTFSAWARLALS